MTQQKRNNKTANIITNTIGIAILGTLTYAIISVSVRYISGHVFNEHDNTADTTTTVNKTDTIPTYTNIPTKQNQKTR